MAQWFDAATWVHERLNTALSPTWLVTPELDAGINRYPALVWSLATRPRDRRGIWVGTLTLVVLCDADTAKDAIPQIDEIVAGWETPGPMNSVELQTHTAGPKSDVSESIKQYTLIYSLTWDL